MNKKTSSSNKNNFRYFSKSKTSKSRKQKQTTKGECKKISSNLSKSRPERNCANKSTKKNTILQIKMKKRKRKSNMKRNILTSSGAKKYTPKFLTLWKTTLSTDFPNNKTSILLKNIETGTFTNSECTKTKCKK